MTGLELVTWIFKHDALDKQCVIQYRDSGGSYLGGEVADNPIMAFYKRDADGYPYDVDITYGNGLVPNCFVV